MNKRQRFECTSCSDMQTKKQKLELLSMNNLPNEILDRIFSFCKGFEYPCLLVCARWTENIKRYLPVRETIERIVYDDELTPSFVKWYYSDPKKEISEKTLRRTAFFGQLELAEWLKSKSVFEDKSNLLIFSYEAIKRGDLNILEWMRQNNYSLDKNICKYAAYEGQLNVLQWALQNGYLLDEWTCTNAARKGHLDILKWARENGCPWDEMTCYYAEKKGNLKILEWARENGCPCNRLTRANTAKGRCLDMLKWIYEKFIFSE